MLNPETVIIRSCVAQLQAGYRQTYGTQYPKYADLLGWIATTTLEAIATSNALYHNVEHTVLVALTGQEILRGKQLREHSVSAKDWLHFIVALLCHDIGYVKGICHADSQPADHTFSLENYSVMTGTNTERVTLAAGSTDASLTPYHVDRGKQFVAEQFGNHPLIDVQRIQHCIELTRFPVPDDAQHRETVDYPGLARAADLIGQLGDPRYLEKLPALFQEFEEIGTNVELGYRHPGDLRVGYPQFFWNVVYAHIQQGIYYLGETPQGRAILAHLFGNVRQVEREQGERQIEGDRQPAISPTYPEQLAQLRWVEFNTPAGTLPWAIWTHRAIAVPLHDTGRESTNGWRNCEKNRPSDRFY